MVKKRIWVLMACFIALFNMISPIVAVRAEETVAETEPETESGNTVVSTVHLPDILTDLPQAISDGNLPSNFTIGGFIENTANFVTDLVGSFSSALYNTLSGGLSLSLNNNFSNNNFSVFDIDVNKYDNGQFGYSYSDSFIKYCLDIELQEIASELGALYFAVPHGSTTYTGSTNLTMYPVWAFDNYYAWDVTNMYIQRVDDLWYSTYTYPAVGEFYEIHSVSLGGQFIRYGNRYDVRGISFIAFSDANTASAVSTRVNCAYRDLFGIGRQSITDHALNGTDWVQINNANNQQITNLYNNGDLIDLDGLKTILDGQLETLLGLLGEMAQTELDILEYVTLTYQYILRSDLYNPEEYKALYPIPETLTELSTMDGYLLDQIENTGLYNLPIVIGFFVAPCILAIVMTAVFDRG